MALLGRLFVINKIGQIGSGVSETKELGGAWLGVSACAEADSGFD
jgi:hypothetical protein